MNVEESVVPPTRITISLGRNSSQEAEMCFNK